MPNIVAKGSYTMIDSMDGATMLLTNDTIAIPTDSAGANGNYTGASTTFIVLLGAVDDSANWTVTATPSAGIAGTLAGRTYTVTSITADAAYVDLKASQQGFASVTRRLSVVRIKNGITTYTWIKYADSATGIGLSNDPTGKAYIGFAYNKTTATESNTASDYTWSLVKGEQGNQGVPGAKGADGVTTYTWIKYSDNPDGTGLYDTPTTSTKYIGIATNKTTATESTNKADYTWSLFKGSDGSNGLDGSDGLDGLNGASIFLYQRTTATPAVPSTTCTYTFSTGVLTGANNGWVQKIPAGTTPLWVTTATAISNTATDTITPSEWATPVIMAQSGVDGKHGAGSYVVTVANQASIPNDAGKDNHILQLSGRNAIAGDILTYMDSGKTFSKSYLRGASTWSEFQFVFDGSAIVNGTLAAETLKSGTSITDKLHISSTKNPAEMTLSGTSDWRIWLGNAVATSAPFRVDKWGNLTAANANLTNATVVGKVTATSGSFTGTVNASSGSFTGTVNANAGTMNNITIAENCNVLGTVYAERIVGDITRMIRASGNFSLAGYKRARNMVCIKPLTGMAEVSGSGTIGIILLCKLNGSEVARATSTASFPMGTNRAPMSVTFQDAFVIPAGTETVNITFEVVAYPRSSIQNQRLIGESLWLMGLW